MTQERPHPSAAHRLSDPGRLARPGFMFHIETGSMREQLSSLAHSIGELAHQLRALCARANRWWRS